MGVLVFLALFLSLIGYSSATFCICKDGLGDSALQKTIDYACGAGADCRPILQNGACFQPNTVKAHCDFAANSYFQNKGQGPGTCDFSGTATPSTNPPTTVAPGCTFPTSASQGTPMTTGIPSTTPGTGTGTGTGIGTGGSTTGGGTTGIYSPFGMAPTGDIGNPSGAPSLQQHIGSFLSHTLTLALPSLVALWGC